MQRITARIIVLTLVSLNAAYGQSAGSRQAFVPQTALGATPASTPYGSAMGTSGPALPIGVSRSRQAVLIIPSAELAPQRAGELAEDLNVMCAVFDRFLYDAGVKTRSWGRGARHQSRSTRCLYLPNFGPLFLIEAEFPLAAPPEAKPKEGETPSEDPLWAQVKSRMRSSRAGGNYIEDRTPIQYDELKVENLKGTLLRAVKHASNLRHVGIDEQIAIVALESSKSRDVIRTIQLSQGYSNYRTISPTTSSPTNVISLRTGKKEVDALATQQITGTAFDSTVQILSYQLPLLESKGR